MRLTWKKQPSETGSRRVCQGPRGAILSADGEELGRVYPFSTGLVTYKGWYWTAAGDGVPWCNTSNAPVEDIDEAKAQCETYVRKCLGLPEKKR